ncbi:carnitine O-acetyltransferase [Martiniozyma asiatica (nom. inval.)]|nr:carnitine O-acetyltransferase [Martiniozyma asiatica]
MSITYSEENSLPKLPLPDLRSTITQALIALEPLVSNEEFQRLTIQSEQFLKSNEAQVLQLHLSESAKNDDNYLNGEGISPTTANVYGELRGNTLPRNPFFILEDDPLKNFVPTQEFRAAVLIISSLRFMNALKAGVLKPDINPTSGKPMTMTSYSNLFGTNVVPFKNGVNMVKYEDSKHIAIMSRGQFYRLDVLSNDNQIWFTKHELNEIINEIITDSQTVKHGNATVGVFTTESKQTWKAARVKLEQTNPEAMKIIETALFIICLDHESPKSEMEKIQYVAHGTSRIDANGSQVGTCTNRYYDKLNIIVTKNAVAACIYPAAIIDGTTALRFISDIYTDSVLRLARMIGGKNYTLWPETNTVPVNSQIEKPKFEKISFNLPNNVSNGLRLAESRLADIIQQHEYVCKKINRMGKKYIRDKMQLPVDSFIQISVQITYYALYGKAVSTFEPISTRQFKDARTEPICVQTCETLQLCQKFISQISDAEKWEDFMKCVEAHKSMIKNAASGGGFERHLSALRSAFIQKDALSQMHPQLPKIENHGVPPLLFEPALESLYKPELLIANCGNPALDFFGITPSIPTGFGIGYIIKDESITFVGSSQWRQTGRFLDTLERVFLELKRMWKSVIHASKTGVANRDDKLQSYINSIPMSMMTSNNSRMKPYLHSSSSSTTSKEGDGYILGGYDYFDVDQVGIRSGFVSTAQSRAQSRVLTREASKVDLQKLVHKGSFVNVGSVNSRPSDVGRKVLIEQEL